MKILILKENIAKYVANEECKNTEILPSNARYCPICGKKSLFYQNNLLKAWDYRNINSSNTFMDIPDGIDEELPFN